LIDGGVIVEERSSIDGNARKGVQTGERYPKVSLDIHWKLVRRRCPLAIGRLLTAFSATPEPQRPMEGPTCRAIHSCRYWTEQSSSRWWAYSRYACQNL